MRGIVAEIRDRKAVLICDGGSFKEVTNKNYTVGQIVTTQSVKIMRYAAIAACFILICTSFIGGYSLYYTPVSFAYVDINPSFRLDINRFDKVIDVVSLNADAEELARKYELDISDAARCVDAIILGSKESGYLNTENFDVSIEVMTTHDKLKSKIYDLVQSPNSIGYNVAVNEVSSKDNDTALKLNISAGKLKAIKSYTEKFGGDVAVNADKLKQSSIDEIYSELDGGDDEKANNVKKNNEPNNSNKQNTNSSSNHGKDNGDNYGKVNGNENEVKNDNKNDNVSENGKSVSEYKNDNTKASDVLEKNDTSDKDKISQNNDLDDKDTLKPKNQEDKSSNISNKDNKNFKKDKDK